MALIIMLALVSLPAPIQFPTSIINAVRGYGDYNASDEFHRGLDFLLGSAGEGVRVPYAGSANVPIAWCDCGDSIGDMKDMIVLLDRCWSDSGWAYGHLDFSDTLNTMHPKLGRAYTDTIAPCIDHPHGRHVHLCWLARANIPPPVRDSICPQPGYFNPYLCLVRPGSPFDEVIFRPINETPSGIVVAPEGQTVPQQSPNWGVLDLYVLPVSAFLGIPNRDSCGVCCIKYRIRQHNPAYDGKKGEWPVIPECDWRYLIKMCEPGILPDDGDTTQFLDEFLAVYPLGDVYENIYCITNSTPVPLPCDSGPLAHVHHSGYNRNADWADGIFCRGAWDTKLARSNPSDDPVAHSNVWTTFADGKYAVEVSARSQASHFETTRMLPVNDVELPDSLSTIVPIIVDNFIPYFLDQVPNFL